METSAATETPNLTDSQVLELLKERRPTPVPATQPERWKGAACLFIVFLILAVISRVSGKFKVMFEEMEFGTLPNLTNWVLGWGLLQLKHPWIFTSGMFITTWLYFSWVCNDRRRLIWFHLLVMGLAIVLGCGGVFALVNPLIGSLEKIGP